MKLYVLIGLIQLFMYYIFPMFAGPTDAMGMVFLIIISTFTNSIIIGSTNFKYKYYYPLFASIIFIPSIFIYYNESALVHSVWYLVISSVGVTVGIIINLVINKFVKKSIE